MLSKLVGEHFTYDWTFFWTLWPLGTGWQFSTHNLDVGKFIYPQILEVCIFVIWCWIEVIFVVLDLFYASFYVFLCTMLISSFCCVIVLGLVPILIIGEWPFWIAKRDFKSHKLRFYPFHKIFKTLFTLKLFQNKNPDNLIYL